MNNFIPKNYKYKKIHKNVRIKQKEDHKRKDLNSVVCGLKVLKSGTITSVVFEAARRAIKRKLKRLGVLYINGFPHIPITHKAIGLRMGKGTGNISSWVFPIKEGRILFELNGVNPELGKIALESASNKLNLPTKVIINKFQGSKYNL